MLGLEFIDGDPLYGRHFFGLEVQLVGSEIGLEEINILEFVVDEGAIVGGAALFYLKNKLEIFGGGLDSKLFLKLAKG